MQAYDVDEIRKTYPKAYAKWTEADEMRLAEAFRAGQSIEDLAVQFQRQPGAIKSRLVKLELIDDFHFN